MTLTDRLSKSAFGAFVVLSGLAASMPAAYAGSIPVAAPEPSPVAVFAVAGTALGAALLFARLRKRAADPSK